MAAQPSSRPAREQSSQQSPWATSRPGSRMNRRRVIVWMTIGVFIVLTVLATLFFQGIPPWPVLVCFAISHTIFCVLVAGVKPYKGPYTRPMEDSTLGLDETPYRPSAAAKTRSIR